MINLSKCSCNAKKKDAPVYQARMCICPKIHAIVGIGRAIVSSSIPIVKMLWWHAPKSCPKFTSKPLQDNGLIPILSSRVYKIFRRNQRGYLAP